MCGKKPTNPHKRKGIPYRTYLHKRANSRYRSRTCYFLLRRQAWLSVPLICSAVRRSRTSKSFPTECLASISNTIMGIRLSASQYTDIYQEAYLLKEGVSNATLGELVEWDTNSRTRRDWFTVSLLCPLAYPPIPEVRFCWTITSHKTGFVIFHAYTHYCAHVRLQPVTVNISAKILGWFPPLGIGRTWTLVSVAISVLPVGLQFL